MCLFAYEILNEEICIRYIVIKLNLATSGRKEVKTVFGRLEAFSLFSIRYICGTDGTGCDAAKGWRSVYVSAGISVSNCKGIKSEQQRTTSVSPLHCEGVSIYCLPVMACAYACLRPANGMRRLFVLSFRRKTFLFFFFHLSTRQSESTTFDAIALFHPRSNWLICINGSAEERHYWRHMRSLSPPHADSAKETESSRSHEHARSNRWKKISSNEQVLLTHLFAGGMESFARIENNK